MLEGSEVLEKISQECHHVISEMLASDLCICCQKKPKITREDFPFCSDKCQNMFNSNSMILANKMLTKIKAKYISRLPTIKEHQDESKDESKDNLKIDIASCSTYRSFGVPSVCLCPICGINEHKRKQGDILVCDECYVSNEAFGKKQEGFYYLVNNSAFPNYVKEPEHVYDSTSEVEQEEDKQIMDAWYKDDICVFCRKNPKWCRTIGQKQIKMMYCKPGCQPTLEAAQEYAKELVTRIERRIVPQVDNIRKVSPLEIIAGIVLLAFVYVFIWK